MNLQHGGGITPFYTTIINTSIPICKVLNGNYTNVAATWIIDTIKDTLPKNFIHPCPYVGSFKAFNISLTPNEFVTQFIKGRYKASYRFFDEQDDNIVTFFLGFEL